MVHHAKDSRTVKIGSRISELARIAAKPPPPQYVAVYDSKGELLAGDFSIFTLRRFSRLANDTFFNQKEELPEDAYTTLRGERLYYLALPKRGTWIPAPQAFKFLLKWMDTNRKASSLAPLKGPKIDNSIANAVHALGAAEAFELRPAPVELKQTVLDHIENSYGVNASEFELIWNMLPHRHLIVFRLIERVVRLQREKTASEELELKIKSMMETDDALDPALKKEWRIQDAKASRELRRAEREAKAKETPK